MSLEVRVDDGLCLGALRCLHLAPGAFELNAVGQAEATDLDSLSEAELVEVARQCPNFAIVVVRDGEVVVGGD
jgi:ferredoxin